MRARSLENRTEVRRRARSWLAASAALAVLALLAVGCGGGSGDSATADSGGETTADTSPDLPDTTNGAGDAIGDAAGCTPACDPVLCLACEKGACTTTCAAGETCVNGACEPPATTDCTTDADCTAPCTVCDRVAGTCADDCSAEEVCHVGQDSRGVCEVPPACDCAPCEDCDATDIWAPVCATRCTGDELCHDGECAVPPACDCAPCEECDTADLWAPVCASRCAGDEQCNVGAVGGASCQVPPACDCAPCEACDQTDPWHPTCVPLCDPFACETCGEDDACVTTCDGDACEVCDGAGECASGCAADTQYCRAGACLDRPTVACDEIDGFCDGSVIDELVLEAAPDAATGEPGCCCDFSGDGTVDNALARLIAIAEPFLGYDRDYFNQGIDAQIRAGSLLLLVEFLGLDDLVDDDYLAFNLYVGADANDDPEDNLSGSAEFWVDPISLDADGEPQMSFRDAWIEGGRLHGGPSQFLMPLDLVGQSLPILLVVDGATVEADVTASDVGYGLSNGVVCGWLHREKIAAGVNQFTATNCGCLGYAGDFITLQGGAMQCSPIPPTASCSDFDYIGRICNQLAEACGALAFVLPALFDLDLTEDGKGDALSLGVTLGATGAAIVGVQP